MSYERMQRAEVEPKAQIEALLNRAKAADQAERNEPDLDVPAEITRRQERLEVIRAARERLEQCQRDADTARGRSEGDERKPRDGDGKPKGGGTHAREFGVPAPKAQDKFTDPQSRIMKRAGGGFDYAYNAQAADGGHGEKVPTAKYTAGISTAQVALGATQRLGQERPGVPPVQHARPDQGPGRVETRLYSAEPAANGHNAANVGGDKAACGPTKRSRATKMPGTAAHPPPSPRPLPPAGALRSTAGGRGHAGARPYTCVMWIDTHCHLDAAEFDADRDAVVARAAQAGVTLLVIPAVEAAGFERTAACARRYGFAYALGIHPLAVASADPAQLALLRHAAQAALADPHFVAIGEIGLDQFTGAPDIERQQWFYAEQLKLAAELGLPVILHVRRSADRLLYHLRRSPVRHGIAHAFNGSAEQAQGFVDLGLRLGFGGAATYDGSLRIRRHAVELAPESLVLETDAPDIPPQWLRDGGVVRRNEPAELPRMAAVIAGLRSVAPAELAAQCRRNALAALPRLAALVLTRVPAVLAAFVAGDILLQQLAQLPAPATCAALALAAMAGGALLGAGRRRAAPPVQGAGMFAAAALLAALLGFGLGGARAQLRLASALAVADEGRSVRVRAVVASLPTSGDGSARFTARIDAVRCSAPTGWVAPGAAPPGDPDCFVVPRRVGLSWHGADARLLPAQRWEWTLRLRRPQALLNPAGFDAEAWMLEQDIRALGSVRAGAHDLPPVLLQERVVQADALIDRARAQVRAALQEHLQDRPYAPVIVALVMGDQGGIAEADWSLFNRTGISHLVSISGLHITMIAGRGGVRGRRALAAQRHAAAAGQPARGPGGGGDRRRAVLLPAGRLGRSGAAHAADAQRGGPRPVRAHASGRRQYPRAGGGAGLPLGSVGGARGRILAVVRRGGLHLPGFQRAPAAAGRLARHGRRGRSGAGRHHAGTGAADTGHIRPGVAGGAAGQCRGHSAGELRGRAAGAGRCRAAVRRARGAGPGRRAAAAAASLFQLLAGFLRC